MVEQAMRNAHYGEWTAVVFESVVRACESRLAEKMGETERAKRNLEHQVLASFFWVPALAERLKEYEGNRDRYPVFSSFIPRLFEALDELAPEVLDVPMFKGTRPVESMQEPTQEKNASIGKTPPVNPRAFKSEYRPIFSLDARMELIWVLSKLGESEGRKLSAIDPDLNYFESVREHEAVKVVKGYDAFETLPNFVFHFGALPDFLPLAPPNEDMQRYFTKKETTEISAVLRKFVLDSRYLDWCKEREKSWASKCEIMNKEFAPVLKCCEEVAGIWPKELTGIITALVPSPDIIGSFPYRNGIHPAFVLLAAAPENDPARMEEWRKMWEGQIIKTFSQATAMELQLPPIPKEPEYKWLNYYLKQVDPELPTWENYIRSSLQPLLYLRCIEKYSGVPITRHLEHFASFMPWVPALMERWQRVEKQNGQAVSLAAALPELMRVFEEREPIVTGYQTCMIGIKKKANKEELAKTIYHSLSGTRRYQGLQAANGILENKASYNGGYQ